MPSMRFAQFADVKTELGTQPGLSIQMMTYNNLKLGGKLTEGVHMKTQAMSSTMKSITVSERGNAVSVSELALKASITSSPNANKATEISFVETTMDTLIAASDSYGKATIYCTY